VDTPVNTFFPFLEFSLPRRGVWLHSRHMANQRMAGKKKVGVWLTDEEQERLKKRAQEAGFDNLADWMRALINRAPEPSPGKRKSD